MQRLLRSVRHWTSAGLLSLVAEKHPGGGFHRVYTRDALYEAALIYELTRYGLNTDEMEKKLRKYAKVSLESMQHYVEGTIEHATPEPLDGHEFLTDEGQIANLPEGVQGYAAQGPAAAEAALKLSKEFEQFRGRMSFTEDQYLADNMPRLGFKALANGKGA